MRHRRALRCGLVLGATTGVALLLVGQQASAESPVSVKRAQAARVLAELRGLDDRLERSVEAYNLARIRLASNARALTANARELRVVRRNLLTAQEQIAGRLRYLYENGEAELTLPVLLGARSLGDLVDRLEVARRVAGQDARVLSEVQTFRARVVRQRETLRREHKRRAELTAALSSQRADIEARLGERQQLLASIKDEIARLQANERARQEELRRQAEARIAAARADRQAQPAPPPTNDLGASAVTPDGIAVAPDTRHAHVVPIAMRYLGVPYLWGGASPETGFDCSGLVLYVYAQVGVSLPHNAAMQYQYGIPVAKEDLEPGDIVFFNNLGHDGIYIGNGQFIQAPRTGDVVKISSLSEPWYASGYVGARRLP